MIFGGPLVRAMTCFALVLATWNPTGNCFLVWVGGPAPLPLKAVSAAALLLAHVLFIRIAWLSLGGAGMVFFASMFLLGVLSLSELGAIDLRQDGIGGWLLLSVLSLVLLTGLSWSVIKRRLTGQSNSLSSPP